MIVKKLLAPLINRGGILNIAEHCYIACASISDAGFDMLITKVSKKCTVHIVTGLELPTSPTVLKRILTDFPERVAVKIHTRGSFNAKVYAFDLPCRKRIAFIGSADFTMDGFQKNEELSYQLDSDKEVEEVKVWFERYFEEGFELSERLVIEYEKIYPSLIEKASQIKKEQQQLLDLVTEKFNWDNVDFQQQYFKRADYAALESTELQPDGGTLNSVSAKLTELHKHLADPLGGLGLQADADALISLTPGEVKTEEGRHNALSLTFGRNTSEIKLYSRQAVATDFMQLHLSITSHYFGIALVLGMKGTMNVDREYFRNQMKNSPKYRLEFFKGLRHLGREFSIAVAGDSRSVYTFRDQDELWNYTKLDNSETHPFVISRHYQPDSVEVSELKIAHTVLLHAAKLASLFKLMKDKKFER